MFWTKRALILAILFCVQRNALCPVGAQTSDTTQQTFCNDQHNLLSSTNVNSVILNSISASAAASAAAASTLASILTQQLSLANKTNGNDASFSRVECKTPDNSKLLSSAASTILTAAQALSSAATALDAYLSANQAAASTAATDSTTPKSVEDFISAQVTTETTTSTEAPTTTTEEVTTTEQITTTSTEPPTTTSTETSSTAAFANDVRFNGLNSSNASSSFSSSYVSNASNTQNNGVPPHNLYALLFSLLWRPPVFSGPIYIDKCVGCQVLSDALDSAPVDSGEKACRIFVESNLETPLRPKQLEIKVNELKRKNAADPTFALLQCCHQKFAAQFFGAREAAMLKYANPSGLLAGKTCGDMVNSLLKLTKGDFSKRV